MKTAITLERVGREYVKGKERFWGIRDLDLNIYKGEIISIIGPSGCGKTTTLKILGGILDVSEGCVSYAHGDVEKVRMEGKLGYVPQSPALLPNRTVLQNILFPFEMRGGEQDKSLVDELISFTELSEFRQYYPYQLSGGMKQKVAIVRALVYGPEILLMDEPFSSLDEIMREKLDLELLRIQKAFDKTIVFVTHSIEEAAFISDRIAVLSAAPGKIVDIISSNMPDERTLETKKEQVYFDQINSIREVFGRV
ncbi:MAG: ATP-binding cassette domain-containing protein [Candidatus Pacebacteria bacterium]|nr:ATP-binding cassette domain-containing protein [Candidatus Paceibacterota bacterium]